MAFARGLYLILEVTVNIFFITEVILIWKMYQLCLFGSIQHLDYFIFK